MLLLLQAFITGILATFVMTMFMNVSSVITGYNLRVPSILGSMLTLKTKPSGQSSRGFWVMVTGNIAHYFVGIVFAYIYLEAMLIAGFQNTLGNALGFGIIAGISAVIFWASFIKLHPLAPAIQLHLYLIFIFMAHVIFAISVCLALMPLHYILRPLL